MRKKLSIVEKLIKAEEDYLKASGWKKIKVKGASNYWSPNDRVGYVFPGDKVYRDSALDAQKGATDFPLR